MKIKGDFFTGDVDSGIAKNATFEANKAAQENDILLYVINWHLRRLGKITASKFDAIAFKEIKQKGQRKDNYIDFLTKNNKALLDFELKDKGFESYDEFKVATLKEFTDQTEGTVIMTQGTETYMDRLLWECDLDLDRLINECSKNGAIPDWLSASSKSMSYGTKYEPIAANEYMKLTGIEPRVMPTMFFDKDGVIAATSDLFGVSTKDVKLPDGSIMKKGRKVAVEIKNPYNGANHYKNIRKEEIDPRYISQCIGNMVCQKADEVHFFSYDDRVKRNKTSLFRLMREDVADLVADLEYRLNRFKDIYFQELKNHGLEIPRRVLQKITR